VRALAFLVFAALYSSALLAAPQTKPTLLDLAEKKFAPRKLTEAEQKLFTATEKGEPASALSSDNKENDPVSAANWPDKRVVHVECLEWLCTDHDAAALVTSHGIKIYGARVDGDLNLEDTQIAFSLVTWKCAFNGNVLLRHTHIKALYLLASRVNALNAEGAEIDGSLFLRNDFKADGDVNLLGAKIGGSLECDGAQLSNPKGKALNADRINVAGYVFLRHGFKAEGEVNFLGATIGANLECDGAQLSNPTGKALNADRVNVTGYVFLRGGFKAEGEVNLLSATIGANLECDGAQLSNPTGKALYADGAKINGGLYLRKGFKAIGEVSLLSATIGGSLVCTGAQLSNPKGKALNADKVKVAGSVFLKDGFSSEGEIDFRSATIGSNLECDGAQLSNPNGEALHADGGKINGGLYLRKGFKAIGEVNLIGAAIGGDLDCDGAELSNPNGYGLDAVRSTIAGGVYLRDHFKADGGVGFFASQVKSQFNWYNTLPAEHTWFDLRSAKVATLLDNESSWPVEGSLFLNAFAYDRIHEDSPVTAESRLRWLHRQPHDKFLPQPYEQLALVLRSMGHEREARAVMIEKNRDHARYLAEHGGRSRFLSHEWWWYNVFGRLIGYGYAPARAFFISTGIILLGWWRFHRGFKKGLISPSNEKGYEKDSAGNFVLKDSERAISDEYPRFNAFVYSLESFVPLLKLDQSSNWVPNANRGKPHRFWRLSYKSGGVLRMYLWCHIILGWVLTSLWVGALTGLVKS
jgi:hypothetical protein